MIILTLEAVQVHHKGGDGGEGGVFIIRGEAGGQATHQPWENAAVEVVVTLRSWQAVLNLF